jgi:heptaprenyl diphosphate synthase
MWPPLPVPGLKLGLANIAVLIALVSLGPARAVAVSVGRVFIVALATGTIGGPVFALSLAGAMASLGTMSLLRRFGPLFSVVGWAVAGAAAHCLAQLGSRCLSESSPRFALAPLSSA